MSEILARIQVRETAGIRRFLYPLQAQIRMPNGISTSALGLVDSGGLPIPCQLHSESGDGLEYTLNFAVSLEPFDHREYKLVTDATQAGLDDPLLLTTTAQNALRNIQKRFSVSLNGDGLISEVIYDDIAHLSQAMTITRNGELGESKDCEAISTGAQLAGRLKANGYYDADLCGYETLSDITACKSWASVTHRLETPQPDDEVVFTLPLAISSPTLACDFGVGGYVFGKLDENASEIVWRTEFSEEPFAKWTVSTAGRVDYVGEVETAEDFVSQRWFHLIDSDKALAVAITELPKDCFLLTVQMTHTGDITISMRLGEAVSSPVEFGLCYHFLNDVPAIAAATNPQSILLPPRVEVANG